MVTKTQIGALLVALFVSYATITYLNDVRIKVNNTNSIFYIKEGNDWIPKAYEYGKLMNGTKSINMTSVSVTTNIDSIAKTVIIRRVTNYINGAQLVDTYFFDGSVNDVELFPIYHKVEVINGNGLVFQYDAKKLAYSGITINGVSSPQVFGKLKITWDSGYYYSKLSNAGTLTVKYKITASYTTFNVRIFDPSVWTKVRAISIKNMNNSFILSEYHPVNILFNTSAEITQGDMKSDCSDVRFYYGATELMYNVTNCNTINTIFTVRLAGINISAGTNQSGFSMYYGNPAATSVAASISNINSTEVLSDMVLNLKMNENTGTTTYDHTSYGHNFTFSGSPLWQPSIHDFGINFSSSSDYVYAVEADVNDVDLGNTSWTIAFWVKMAPNTISSRIYDKRTPTVGPGIIIYRNASGNIELYYHITSPAEEDFIYSSIVANDTWTHVGIVCNSTTGTNQSRIFIYINGLLNVNTTVTNGNLNNTRTPYIGGVGSSDNFKGEIDDFTITHRVLTPGEMKILKPDPVATIGSEASYSAPNNTITNLYLDGLSQNTSYELGTVSIIRANVTNSTGQILTNGLVCLDISGLYGFGTNYACANGTVEYNLTTQAIKQEFDDSFWNYQENATENYTVAFDENPENATDSNWDTYTHDSLLSGDATLYMNYTKPINALYSSLLQVRMGGSLESASNYSISSDCWNYSSDKLVFKINSQIITLHIYCYNGSNWVDIGAKPGDKLHEEAMWWNITSLITAKNVSGMVSSITGVVDSENELGNTYWGCQPFINTPDFVSMFKAKFTTFTPETNTAIRIQIRLANATWYPNNIVVFEQNISTNGLTKNGTGWVTLDINDINLTKNTNYCMVIAYNGTFGDLEWQYGGNLTLGYPPGWLSTNSGSSWSRVAINDSWFLNIFGYNISYVSLSKYDIVNNASFTLKGYTSDGDYPTNVDIFINNTFIRKFSQIRHDNVTITTTNNSVSSESLLYNKSSAVIRYFNIPKDASIKTASLNITGYDTNYVQMNVSTFQGGTFGSSLAIDSIGNIHTTYTYGTDKKIYYSYYDTAWHTEIINMGNYVLFPSITLDSNNVPTIFFYLLDITWGVQRLTRTGPNTWTGDEISLYATTPSDSLSIGQTVSVATDTANNHHACFYDWNNGDLHYYKTGLGDTAIDTTGNVGRWCSLAIDSHNNPHISYYDDTNMDLKYARYDGTSWILTSIDTANDVGGASSITIDSNNNIAIAYRRFTDGTLRYITNRSGSWVATTIITPIIGVQTDISLYLDSNDAPWIISRNNNTGNITLSRNITGSWENINLSTDIFPYDSTGVTMSERSLSLGIYNKSKQCSTNCFLHLFYHNGTMPIYAERQYPLNPSISVGGVTLWNYSGRLDTTSSITFNTSNIISWISTCQNDSTYYCQLPLMFGGASSGTLTYSNINITYNYNFSNVNINTTAINNYIKASNDVTVAIPIKIISNSGVVEANNLNINYLGSDNITVFAHYDGNLLVYNSSNNTKTINVYYSGYNYSFPSKTKYLEFLPSSPGSKNVTPYGQTIFIPILNITTRNYDVNMNLSVRLNATYSCINLTISNTSTKSDGFVLNTTWKDMFVNKTLLYNGGLWLWADYGCQGSAWRLFHPQLYLRGCAVNSICSESVV